MNEAMEATKEILSDWRWFNNRVATAQLIERMRKHGLSLEETIDILYITFMVAMDEGRRNRMR